MKNFELLIKNLKETQDKLQNITLNKFNKAIKVAAKNTNDFTNQNGKIVSVEWDLDNDYSLPATFWYRIIEDKSDKFFEAENEYQRGTIEGITLSFIINTDGVNEIYEYEAFDELARVAAIDEMIEEYHDINDKIDALLERLEIDTTDYVKACFEVENE